MAASDQQDGSSSGSEDLDRALLGLTDDARAEAHARTRRLTGSLRRQAEEEGTVAGVLLDLAERHEHLVLSTAGGRTLRGTIAIIGADFVALRSPAGVRTYVPTGRIASVRTEPVVARTVGDRVVQVAETLRGHLGTSAEERQWVSVHSLSTETVSGTLLAVGQDLLTVRSDQGTTTYLPTALIDDLTLG